MSTFTSPFLPSFAMLMEGNRLRGIVHLHAVQMQWLLITPICFNYYV